MLSSRGCLQLLLGWALLLGQPVGGTDEVAEMETEAEAELPSSAEEAAEAPEPETSEEPLEESYNMSDDDIWFMDPSLASEEQLEKMASLERMLLENPKNYLVEGMRSSCLSTMNEDPELPFYKLLEDTDLQTKKSIGSVSTFTLFVGITNCSRTEGMKEAHFFRNHYAPWHRSRPLSDPSRPKCTLEPESMMQKCKVYVYNDGETGVSSVFHTACNYIQIGYEEPQTPLE